MEDYRKKYEDAIVRAKAMIEIAANQDEAIGFASTIFPELKESKDEEVRKEIIKYLKLVDKGEEDYAHPMVSKWIMWLEKQCETFTKKEVDDAYLKGMCDAKRELEKQCEQNSNKVSLWKHWSGSGIAGNGEGKLIYLIKNGTTYNLSSCLNFECDYIELSELDNLIFEEQDDQQWSEEDEKMFVRILYSPNFIKEEKDWLKSIKDRVQPQPKQDWSEEDKEMLELLGIAATNFYPTWTSSKIHSWINSIKSQHKWKPTRQQLDTLYATAVSCDNDIVKKILLSLYEQLKL